jgi:glutamate:GABA antiporter
MVRNHFENASEEIEGARKRVEEKSAVFKKQLGVKDIMLAQILTLVGGYGIGTAAMTGSAHLLLWVFAILLFFVPLACVVIFLVKLMPLEGGPYQWVKLGFNDFVGFMVAWNTWLFAIVYISSIGLRVATSLAYALGPGAAWMAGDKWFIALLSCIVISTLTGIAILGLGLGKWVHNLGGAILLVVIITLLTLPLLNLVPGTTYPPFTLTIPALSLLSITIFIKMAVFSFGGFEYVAILAGECRNPSQTITKSVLIVTPLIALIYILGTHSILAFIPPGNINLIDPFAQVFTVGLGSFQLAASLVSAIILAMLIRDIAQASLTFTGNTRLPLVAGWDQLLPHWFTRLHHRYKTPVNSIAFVGLITLCIGLAGIIEVGQQEAYQLLQSSAGIFIGLTQVMMFAIPLFGLKRTGRKVPFWISVTSAAGFGMTFLFIVLSVFPIIEVKSWLAYSAKIIAVIVVGNMIGVVLFRYGERRRRKR